MALLYVNHDCVVLFLRADIDQIVGIFARHRLIGRNDHRFQVVDTLELERLGVSCTGHAGKSAVKAEIVLEGD